MIPEIKEALRKITGIDESLKKDLFELAEKNKDHITALFIILTKEIGDSSKGDALEQLAQLLGKWGLTVNIGWKKVNWVCENRRIPTTYEIAMTNCKKENISYEDALKNASGIYYDLRITFNKEIKNEELFKYVAFNIGNLGLQSFGEFCFFVENSMSVKFDGLAFLKGNSLDSYSDSKNKLDLKRLLEDVSAKQVVEQLVAIKHKNDILNDIAEDEWPNKICNEDCYVEGLLVDELKLESIKCVKIDAKNDEQYMIAAMNLRYGEDISSVDADMLRNYLTAKTKIVEAGLTIQTV